ncbi:MAG: hypothetical protein Q8O70_00755 [Burkholderiales bacterium]|nr:hypothetical protein [Burkholderiales bacterium]
MTLGQHKIEYEVLEGWERMPDKALRTPAARARPDHDLPAARDKRGLRLQSVTAQLQEEA